jgi:5-formyltetrahydrofolate cyclo-ligase
MKDRIRNELLNIRKNLSKDDVIKNSHKIINRLKENKIFRKADTILFYISYNNEVNTHDLIKEYISKGKTVVVPISNKADNSLILSRLSDWDDLENGAYGILEPKESKVQKIRLDKIEVVLVPGIGFDKFGNRIGHGKGYYDRLLKNFTGKLSVGLIFEDLLVEKIPINIYDVPVDMVITEDRIINCL